VIDPALGEVIGPGLVPEMLEVGFPRPEQQADAVVHTRDDEPLVRGAKAHHTIGTQAIAQEDDFPFLDLGDFFLEPLAQKVRSPVEPVFEEAAGKAPTIDLMDFVVNRLAGDNIDLPPQGRFLGNTHEDSRKPVPKASSGSEKGMAE
jgi:hypothetical protein